ncbi:MAG: copper amine oxidase N-terminal domain-containing protein [Fimbriimonas sp.]
MRSFFVLFPLLALAIPQQQVPRRASTRNSPLAIKVRLDGELVKFADTAPVMEGSRVLVPMRGVFEKMGATLEWDASSRTVTAQQGDRTIVLPVGKSEAKIGGETVALDQPAMVIDRRTFVPLRFLGQALGAKVDWLTADRTVDIQTGG